MKEEARGEKERERRGEKNWMKKTSDEREPICDGDKNISIINT